MGFPLQPFQKCEVILTEMKIILRPSFITLQAMQLQYALFSEIGNN
jgi:hypothetical protein